MAPHAVVLFNLGGPDSPAAVRPFLRNLFSDRAIIDLPGWLRLPLAALVAARRAATARAIYARLGGSSPLLANTAAQARALQAELGAGYRCLIAMRYWQPRAAAVVAELLASPPEAVTLLPLYPHYSTTTTASSLAEWHEEAQRQGLRLPTRIIRCYPTEPGLIAAMTAAVAASLGEVGHGAMPLRLLFSAHGLPLKIVRAGDPYPRQVAETAAAVVAALGRPGLDWRLCYQSRVGPLAWLGPSIDDEIREAGKQRLALVVAPISFVSEHVETLVELDVEYRRLAAESGVPVFRRVMTVGTDPRFIAGLARLVRTGAPAAASGGAAADQAVL